ncbi:patatin-like phospholipase family protein [Fodinibius sp.]|uniref:patatin-like phospholipase family protein n=1 Tax=Fodinibius sp. TaxID=1872440 RepID=UPI002ACD91ED|nr:patatin-like phospholipase family protein [Fodinibius sp.]MDZ7659628.1 patatin-like phospholipase family protein [Fodinibius sp.]
MRRTLLLILFLSLPFLGVAQQEQQEIKNNTDEETKLGLALSGGGAKGFAHIGVLKVLEEEGIPVHMISGTSMGAIIGSLYAIGYSPQEIEEIARTTDWNILLNDSYQINPQQISNSIQKKDTYLVTFPFNDRQLSLPAGLIDGQNISMMLYRLMLPFHDVRDFTKLPIPFSAVATNLATGEPKTFSSGYLPDAVRASIAIPSIFKPVNIDGKSYIDGGVARNLPVEDVQNLGANFVIASDVGEPIRKLDSLNTFVDILFQAVGFHQQESDIIQKEKTDIYIRPNISEFSTFSYEKVDEIIRRGEQAARQALPRIKKRLAKHNTAPSAFKPIESTRQDTILVSDISLNNLKGLIQQQQVFLALDIQLPEKLMLSQLEQKITRLYESELFSQISYRLQKNQDAKGNKLVLEFQHKEQEYAGFSMRYDSQYKAALLFGASFTDNIFINDRITMKLRAGEILELTSDYRIPISLAPLAHVKAEFNLQRSPINYYDQDQALSSIDVEKLTIKPSIAVQLWQKANFEIGLETELYNLNEAIGNTLVLGNTTFLLNPFLAFDFNTLNRPYFPTRGQSLRLKTEFSEPGWGSSASFYQASGRWFSTIPLMSGVNISNELFAGYSSSTELPLHYYYYAGGLSQNPVFELRQIPFMGYPTQQLRAANIKALRSKLQIRINKNIYIGGGMNLAHLSDQWTFNIDQERLKTGYSLSFGATSIVGPIEITLSTPDFTSGYAVKLNMGYHF